MSAKIQVRNCSARLEANHLLTVDFTLEYWKEIKIKKIFAFPLIS